MAGKDDGQLIEVTVETEFLEDESHPERDRYVFSYLILIVNHGKKPAKLLSRHWIITDANGHVQQVQGDGVVGEQPRILPGEGFRYSSGVVLETPVGVMHGSYQMVDDEGGRFDVLIDPFRLANPSLIN